MATDSRPRPSRARHLQESGESASNTFKPPVSKARAHAALVALGPRPPLCPPPARSSEEPENDPTSKGLSRSRSPRRNDCTFRESNSAKGMVRYKCPEHAVAALKALQGSVLLWSSISITIDPKSRDSSTLLVSGLGPHVGWHDLQEHFETAGELTFAQVFTDSPSIPPEPADCKSVPRYKQTKQVHGSAQQVHGSAQKVYYHQAFITDIPSEFEEDAIVAMHHHCGLGREDVPVLVKILPSSIPGSETCACITSYASQDVLQRVIRKLDGHSVWTSSGRRRNVGVSKAKRPKWILDYMAAHGIVDDDPPEESQKKQKVNIYGLPAGTEPDDVWKLHEDHGISAKDFPSRVWMNTPKHADGGTSGCFAYYRDRDTAERVVEQLRGATLLGANGILLHIRIRVASLDEEARRKDATKTDAHTYPAGTMLRGVVESWEDERAFGFIRIAGDTVLPDLFIHQERVVGNIPLVPGTQVSFQAQYFEAKQKWEAVGLEILGTPEEDVDKFLEAPPDVPWPMVDEETASEFVQSCCNTFCKAWDLGCATAAWLARMDQDVLSTVFEEFNDSHHAEQSPYSDDPIMLSPSENIYVTGLPRGFSSDQLQKLFSRFGHIVKSKILNPGFAALLQMSTVGEATLAVEDLNLQTPEGFTSSISVRYVNRDKEVPAGMMLMGTVKTWHQDRAFGYIATNGFGTDVAAFQDRLTDVTELSVGATVLFRAEWSDEYSKHWATTVIASEENVKLRLAANAGIDKRVRDFARMVERRMKLGDSWKDNFVRMVQKRLRDHARKPEQAIV